MHCLFHAPTPTLPQMEGQHQSIPSLGPFFKSNLTTCHCTPAWENLENILLEMRTPDSWVLGGKGEVLVPVH